VNRELPIGIIYDVQYLSIRPMLIVECRPSSCNHCRWYYRLILYRMSGGKIQSHVVLDHNVTDRHDPDLRGVKASNSPHIGQNHVTAYCTAISTGTLAILMQSSYIIRPIHTNITKSMQRSLKLTHSHSAFNEDRIFFGRIIIIISQENN